jgi:4-alpha-glucanotransferase
VREALEALGIRNLLLGLHDPAFPSLPEEEVGRGSPYSEGAARFLGFVRELGFGGLQLGPQGITSAANASPYDGTIFSKNPLSAALLALTRPEWAELLPPDALAALVARRPGSRERVPYAFVFDAHARALAEAARSFRRRRDEGEGGPLERLGRDFDAFREQHAAWLERDALYEVLRRDHRGRHWSQWRGRSEPFELDQRLYAPAPGTQAHAERRRRSLLERHAEEIEAFAFVQFVLYQQHRLLRERVLRLGLKLYGDLQIGLSSRDAWYAQGFLLRDYAMGAPPSRTNPEGQPWNYPVLDPDRYDEPGSDGGLNEGPALGFVRARLTKLLGEFDGVRLDHPHGLVCPWVYRAGEADPLHSVQQGARLFESPDLADHPDLARFAIARPEQLDRERPRYDDGWVRELDEDQVARYARLFDVVMDAARANGRDAGDVACEILSTQPYPLGRVIERYGLGRFRVTQKADVARPGDVYRGENAGPEDWIMLGNHDTRSIWTVAEEWVASGASRRQSEYLATRVRDPGEDRDDWVAHTAADPKALAQAKFADLFVGPACNVMVFFTDLFGEPGWYNRPGTVSDDNWSRRVPPDYRETYAERRARGAALDLPRALARALRARGASFAAAHATLAADLDALAVL